MVVTNGMVIPNYSSKEASGSAGRACAQAGRADARAMVALQDYDRMYAMGVSMYGQMTAGSYACEPARPRSAVLRTRLTARRGAARQTLGRRA